MNAAEKSNTKLQDNKTAWNEAISEAEQQIRELKKAVKVYKVNRDEGRQWPGFNAAGTELPNSS